MLHKETPSKPLLNNNINQILNSQAYDARVDNGVEAIAGERDLLWYGLPSQPL